MELRFVLSVVALLGVLFVAAHAAARSLGASTELFRWHDADPPRGVQEDDDFSWRWHPARRSIDPPRPRRVREPDAGVVRTERIRARVGRR